MPRAPAQQDRLTTTLPAEAARDLTHKEELRKQLSPGSHWDGR
jgi:hypothetical protein